jgi:4a-hydroxytetrahydrobiopterin dehydratase
MPETLAEKKCTPCRGGFPPLTQEEAERFQSQASNWELRDDLSSHRTDLSLPQFSESAWLCSKGW